MISLRIENIKDEIWDQIVFESDLSNFFLTSIWLKIISKIKKLKLIKIGIYKHSKLIGIMPLYVQNYGFLKLGGSPIYSQGFPYLGFVIDKDFLTDDFLTNLLKEIEKFIKRKNINFFRIIFDQFFDIKYCENYSVFDKHTHILNLSLTEEEIFKKMQGRCRTAIRKALKNNIEIIEVDCKDYNWVNVYYNLITNLYKRQGRIKPPYPKVFYSMLSQYIPKQNITILFSKYKDVIISGSIFLKYKNKIYYYDAASNHKYNSYCPNNLLNWYAIKMSKKLGFFEYDFVGSDLPYLAKFKSSFGGELRKYTLVEYYNPIFIKEFKTYYWKIKPFLWGIIRKMSTYG